jgi:hypothetical protein
MPPFLAANGVVLEGYPEFVPLPGDKPTSAQKSKGINDLSKVEVNRLLNAFDDPEVAIKFVKASEKKSMYNCHHSVSTTNRSSRRLGGVENASNTRSSASYWVLCPIWPSQVCQQQHRQQWPPAVIHRPSKSEARTNQSSQNVCGCQTNRFWHGIIECRRLQCQPTTFPSRNPCRKEKANNGHEQSSYAP